MKQQAYALLVCLAVCTPGATAAEMTWGFKNPSFSGQGYSTHVLSVEQLQFNRQKELHDEARAAAERLERAL